MNQHEYSEIQTIIFIKKKMSQIQCVNWLYDHGFKYNKMSETEHHYRYKQTNSKKYTWYMTIPKTNKKEIKFIVGWYPIGA